MADRAYVQPDVITTQGPQIDARSYGSTKNSTTLQAAITGIGANERELLITPGDWEITANITVPVNIVLRVLKGAKFNVHAGVTLTINSPVIAGSYQIFYGSGLTTVNSYPYDEIWWGNVREFVVDKATILDLTTPSIQENANRETLFDDKWLVHLDPKVQFLNPNGVSRNVYMPDPVDSEANKFWISNIDTTALTSLYIWGTDGTALVAVIREGNSGWIVCDKHEWRASAIGNGIRGSGIGGGSLEYPIDDWNPDDDLYNGVETANMWNLAQTLRFSPYTPGAVWGSFYFKDNWEFVKDIKFKLHYSVSASSLGKVDMRAVFWIVPPGGTPREEYPDHFCFEAFNPQGTNMKVVHNFTELKVPAELLSEPDTMIIIKFYRETNSAEDQFLGWLEMTKLIAYQDPQ